MAFLQKSALKWCFHLYSSAREFLLWQFEEFLDKVSVMNLSLLVDCQKRFTVSQTNSMYQIAGFGRGST